MKRTVSLVLVACLVESSVMSARQAGASAAGAGSLRIFVATAAEASEFDEDGLQGLRDSAADLRTRLAPRLDPHIAVVVATKETADLTVVLTGREIVDGMNVVRADVVFKDFRTEFTGADDGMWRPAATDLARNISAWVATNAGELRGAATSPAPGETGKRLTPAKPPLDRRRDVERREALRVIPLLEPGDPIVVRHKGRRSNAYFLSAGDVVTVLNFTDLNLPWAARALLLRIASNRPGFFSTDDGTEFREGSVSVRSDGVFVGGRKLADLSAVLDDVEPSAVLTHSAKATLVVAVLITAASVIGALLLRSLIPST